MKLVLLNFKCSDSEQIAITIRSNQNIIVERKINHFSIFIITVSYSKYILPLIALLLFMEILFHQPTILFAASAPATSMLGTNIVPFILKFGFWLVAKK